MTEQAKFTYSPMEKTFENIQKQLKIKGKNKLCNLQTLNNT